MFPVAFDEANLVLDKPPGMSREECEPLNVYQGEMPDGGPVLISCWKLTREELEEINRTGRVWLLVYSSTTFPVALTGIKPFTPAEPEPS